MPQLLEGTESAITMTVLAMKLASLLSHWLLNRLEGGVKKELTPSESLENTRPFVSVSHLPMPSHILSRVYQSLSGVAMPVYGSPESPSHHFLLMVYCDPIMIIIISYYTIIIIFIIHK